MVRYLQLKSLKTDQVMNVNTVRILGQTGTDTVRYGSQEWKYVADTNDFKYRYVIAEILQIVYNCTVVLQKYTS